jgi:hypothetical protein
VLRGLKSYKTVILMAGFILLKELEEGVDLFERGSCLYKPTACSSILSQERCRRSSRLGIQPEACHGLPEDAPRMTWSPVQDSKVAFT